ncbi:MAG TPA: N-acetyl-gamma-glutamyl-phosphate reductase [Solirubrobacteraceae bacterium]|nr:N-acetyl-gamma-glutamyl-phosphate reductase [Solirubrobacteraceae bacterium]
MSSVPSVLVAGASGYAGALAARLIDRHPDFELAAITSRSEAGRRLSDVYPHHRVSLVMEELDLERHAKVDAAIVAYPHGAAAPLVAALLERGVRVIDLSADFRLRDAATYERWYVTHSHPDLLERAVYGLTELNRPAIADAELVACPGCFPTAAILALAPLAEAGLLADVVIDAKSGVSGAGRGLREDTQFVAVDENVRPYGVGEHRHMPEIDQELARLGAPIIAAFTPHLVPLDQGELLSCYITPERPVGQSELDLWYAERYGSEPFIDLVERPPGVRDVRETNICAIHTHADERTGKVFVFAAIDNLWKGTSSQAVANLNLMFGFSEGRGIA